MKQNDAAAAKRLKRQKDILKKVAVALASILLLVVFLGPFICVISASVQEEQTIKLGAFNPDPPRLYLTALSGYSRGRKRRSGIFAVYLEQC